MNKGSTKTGEKREMISKTRVALWNKKPLALQESIPNAETPTENTRERPLLDERQVLPLR